jgi:hypothetical protein
MGNCVTLEAWLQRAVDPHGLAIDYEYDTRRGGQSQVPEIHPVFG